MHLAGGVARYSGECSMTVLTQSFQESASVVVIFRQAQLEFRDDVSVLEDSPVHQTVSGHSDHRKRQSSFVTMGCCSLISVAVVKSLDKRQLWGERACLTLQFQGTIHQ